MNEAYNIYAKIMPKHTDCSGILTNGSVVIWCKLPGLVYLKNMRGEPLSKTSLVNSIVATVT